MSLLLQNTQRECVFSLLTLKQDASKLQARRLTFILKLTWVRYNFISHGMHGIFSPRAQRPLVHGFLLAALVVFFRQNDIRTFFSWHTPCYAGGISQRKKDRLVTTCGRLLSLTEFFLRLTECTELKVFEPLGDKMHGYFIAARFFFLPQIIQIPCWFLYQTDINMINCKILCRTYGANSSHNISSGVYTPACVISSLRDFALVKFLWTTKSTSSLCLYYFVPPGLCFIIST